MKREKEDVWIQRKVIRVSCSAIHFVHLCEKKIKIEKEEKEKKEKEEKMTREKEKKMMFGSREKLSE